MAEAWGHWGHLLLQLVGLLLDKGVAVAGSGSASGLGKRDTGIFGSRSGGRLGSRLGSGFVSRLRCIGIDHSVRRGLGLGCRGARGDGGRGRLGVAGTRGGSCLTGSVGFGDVSPVGFGGARCLRLQGSGREFGEVIRDSSWFGGDLLLL